MSVPRNARGAPWICSACLSRRAASSTPRYSHASQKSLRRTLTTAISPPPPPPPPRGFANLTHRRLIALHGPDAPQFLHGLVTANVRPSLTAGIYGAFLNAQGRVLNDVFIYPASHSAVYNEHLPQSWREKFGDGEGLGWFVEVDAQDAESLYKHLRRHKLRSKFNIRLVDEGEWNIYSAWNSDDPWTPHSATTPDSSIENVIGTHDARAPGMGRRIILPPSLAASSPLLSDTAPLADLSAYHIRRWLRGVAEGQTEIPRESALPQESNIDFMASGIDFRKGCYIGQELTIRTHHTGVVRKRILPCALYRPGDARPDTLAYTGAEGANLSGMLAAGASVAPAASDGAKRRGRSAGKWLGVGAGNVGLALCRIEMVSDIVLTAGEGSRFRDEDEFAVAVGDEGEADATDRLMIKPFVPDWIRNQIKVKTENRRVA